MSDEILIYFASFSLLFFSILDTTLHVLEQQYDEGISMAEMYDGASIEAKRMIISRMVKKVEVARGYQLNIVFKPEFQEFFQKTDMVDTKIA